MTQQQDSGRLAWADMCRLIAMYGVLVIHISAPIFYDYRNIDLSSFLVANALDSIARVSVPLFAMLSGALLLGRNMSKGMGGVVSRILKVAIPLLFWSVLHVFWLNYWTGKPLDIPSALSQALQGPVMYHLWFVYMTIGVYILLPVLQPISVALLSSKRLAAYFFGLWFLVNSVTIYFPTDIINHLTLTSFLKWPGYFLLGFYLSRSEVFGKVSIWCSAAVFIFASVTTFLISWRLNSMSPVPVEKAFEYFSPNVLIASCAAFHMIRQIRLSAILVRPVAFLSSIVFPVYFMHLLVIDLIKAGLFGFTLNLASMSTFTAIISLSLCTFAICLLLAAMTRVVPYTSKLIG
ncbi:acyltransferase family protein [Pseudomonas sp. V98_8]|jgi:surface polysaccharide O-acyltransferase-like enzyme|uniref:acyltransferase n=1 Tax=Pseudomonas sp. V98_8 TaxID=3044228 RepID=UPI00249F41BC|nr:acyltransferase family protein [Pseudomonas sp. V98_8]MDI3394703.1 acyltransferase family protein [Pseudomonas sp. V98_8]